MNLLSRAFLSLCLSIVAAGAPAAAAGPLDGVWKSDPKQVTFSKRPSVLRLGDGHYECISCAPPTMRVPANGEDQRLEGHPEHDSLAVRIVDERTVELTFKKDGKQMVRTRATVSADGRTYVRDTESALPNGQVEKSNMTWRRVAPAKPGEHALSGGWVAARINSQSGEGSTTVIKTAPGMVNLSTPEGMSYSAKLDGSPAPVTGDPGTTSVKVTQPAPNILVETAYRGDEAFLKTRMVVARDGKTARVTWTNLKTRATGGYVLVRQ